MRYDADNMKLLSLQKRKALAATINKKLDQIYGEPKTMLTYKNPWELLVSVILSAQCTDKKINEVTPALFEKYPTLKSFLDAKPEEFEKMIYSTGFYRAKTKNILAAAQVVHKDFNDQVPRTMQEMLTIPGVARKTANVVLGNAYGVIEGIAIDTHMKRLSNVLGLSSESNPVKIEKDLMQLLPQDQWFAFGNHLISYGREYCHAKKHNHADCPLTSIVEKHAKV